MNLIKTSIRLKQLMEEKKLKQVDILKLALPICKEYDINMNKSDISQYVSGKVKPSQEKLCVLGLALNVTESWLMGFDAPKERNQKEEITMTIGDRIRKQRELLGLSQTELAEKIKVSKQTLYKYEKNIITNIPLDKIEEISKILGISEIYLMGWKTIPEEVNICNKIGDDKEMVKALDRYLTLSEKKKKHVINTINMLSEEK